MNVSNQYKRFLLFGVITLATTACQEQYTPSTPTDSSSAVNVDTTSQPLYRSFTIFSNATVTPAQTGTGVDYLESLDKSEMLPGYTAMGAYISVLVNNSPTRNQLFRCKATVSNGTLVHFISIDSACEGYTVESSLGYLEQSPIGNVVIPVHRCTGAAFNLPGGGTGPFLSPIHNIITVDQTDCMTNSSTPTILGYTL